MRTYHASSGASCPLSSFELFRKKAAEFRERRTSGRAQQSFDVLLTADHRLEFQQNLPQFAIGVVVIITPDLRFRTIRPAIEAIREALISVSPGQVIRVPV